MTLEQAPASVDAAFRRLVDDYRDRCLWFLRRDYYPASHEERCRVLDQIVRHGDLEAYRRASEVRRWLSRPCNETSAGD
jgi:hypothetical protein